MTCQAGLPERPGLAAAGGGRWNAATRGRPCREGQPVANIAARKPPRLRGDAVHPFQAGAAHPDRRAAFFAGDEVDCRPHAQRHLRLGSRRGAGGPRAPASERPARRSTRPGGPPRRRTGSGCFPRVPLESEGRAVAADDLDARPPLLPPSGRPARSLRTRPSRNTRIGRSARPRSKSLGTRSLPATRSGSARPNNRDNKTSGAPSARTKSASA